MEGKVVLGVMACPKLPLASTADSNILKCSPEKMGCLFYGSVGTGTYVQSLSVGSIPEKVNPLGTTLFRCITMETISVCFAKEMIKYVLRWR